MSFTTVSFFNNKGGVGKTSLVYHLSWMFSLIGERVVAVDLDPQANLTSAFLDDDQLEALWNSKDAQRTIAGWVRPLQVGVGDIAEPQPVEINDELALLPGDLALSTFEDDLSQEWARCLDRHPRAFRVISSFWRIMKKVAEARSARLVLMDLGPNLGALNRACLVASDFVVFPLAPDMFSLLGLSNLGPTLRGWRSDWAKRLEANPDPEIILPKGLMQPAGYVLLQHSVRYDRPTRAYERWMNKIPYVYRQDVLGESNPVDVSIGEDPNALASLKHYRTLMPLAQEARKPIFNLTTADGVSGSHFTAAKRTFGDFEGLARNLAEKIGLKLHDRTPPLAF